MSRIHILSLLVSLFFSSMIHAADTAPDKRTLLTMNAEQKAEFLSEMRQMLASIQGIISGIANEDRKQIIKAARYSGNRMARATPNAVREQLPEGFKALGGPTHMMFEEMVVRAPTDEMEDLTELTGQILRQCLACHASYRVH